MDITGRLAEIDQAMSDPAELAAFCDEYGCTPRQLIMPGRAGRPARIELLRELWQYVADEEVPRPMLADFCLRFAVPRHVVKKWPEFRDALEMLDAKRAVYLETMALCGTDGPKAALKLLQAEAGPAEGAGGGSPAPGTTEVKLTTTMTNQEAVRAYMALIGQPMG